MSVAKRCLLKISRMDRDKRGTASNSADSPDKVILLEDSAEHMFATQSNVKDVLGTMLWSPPV